MLNWNNREEKKRFRNNCVTAMGISAIGIILGCLI
jgi:hypothetical protein